MLIKRMILHNFRQYIGTQEIIFSTDKEKNVTVLIGVNTSGKTTLVRAFEWILYNKNEFDDKNLLNKNVADNMQVGERQEVRGTLVIEHNGKEYEISRKQVYTCTGSSVRASVSSANIMYLQPDGQTKTTIESDFNENIERILPRALSSYFFFGGERVGAISTRDDIESSVKGLMGLDVLFNAMTHLKSVISKLKKSMDYAGDQAAADTQRRLDGAVKRKEECESELATVIEQIEYYQAEREKYAALLRANEETAAAQKRREQLNTVISNLEAQIERDKKALVSAFSKNAFSFFSLPLLKHVVDLLDSASEETESVPDMTAEAIDYILKRGMCICGTCISEGSAAQMHLLAERKKQPPESIGSLVRRYREQAMDYISSSDDYYSAIESRFSTLRSNQRELGLRIDERTSLEESLKGAKDVSSLEKDYQDAVRRINSFERERSRLQESIGACKKDIDNYEKALEKYGKANEKNIKIALNIEYAQAVFDWVADAYRSRESSVRSRLEEKVNANFSSMYHGTRTITIDEKYRVKYIDVTTEESDGLKAVKSFAFVSGLVDLAKEALSASESDAADIGPQYYPLVMDAPFSNVDEAHIRNISKILPASAEQVIIAVMKKDWEPASEIMASVVGQSYIIEKDTDQDGNEIDTMTHIRLGE
ncbi:MAG: AAA family ATPase [Candidatus Fimisoma sp.]|nr:AAA family ATPase [Candidatus Fimisoma sp.]